MDPPAALPLPLALLAADVALPVPVAAPVPVLVPLAEDDTEEDPFEVVCPAISSETQHQSMSLYAQRTGDHSHCAKLGNE